MHFYQKKNDKNRFLDRAHGITVLVLIGITVLLCSCNPTYVLILGNDGKMHVELYNDLPDSFNRLQLKNSAIISNLDSTSFEYLMSYDIVDLDSVQEYIPWCSQNDVRFELRHDTLLLKFQPSWRDSVLCFEPYVQINFRRKVRYRSPYTQEVKYLKHNHLQLKVPMKALKEEEIHYFYLDPKFGVKN